MANINGVERRFCIECGRMWPVENFPKPSARLCNRDHSKPYVAPSPQQMKRAKRRARKLAEKRRHGPKVAQAAKKYEEARVNRASRRVTQYKGSRLPLDEQGNQMSKAQYRLYLESEHWTEFKERYAASDKLQECWVCGEGQYELHHHTYARLYREKLEDVIPLCEGCHRKTHNMVKAGKSLSDAHVYVKMRYDKGDNLEV